jgi:hypothetical protein
VEKPRSLEEVAYERLRQIADAYLNMLNTLTAASKRHASQDEGVALCS